MQLEQALATLDTISAVENKMFQNQSMLKNLQRICQHLAGLIQAYPKCARSIETI